MFGIKSVLLLLTIHITIVSTDHHDSMENFQPKCLNSKEPFQPNKPITFCGTSFGEFGCCAKRDFKKIKQKLKKIRKLVKQNEGNLKLWRKCSSTVKDLLCQSCSPFSFHLFETEENEAKIPNGFPRLCTQYCQEFYDNCSAVIQYFDPTLETDDLSLQSFCLDNDELNENELCYPESFQTKEEPDNENTDTPSSPSGQGQGSDNTSSSEPLENVVAQPPSPPRTPQPIKCLCLEKMTSGLVLPLFAVHAGDDSGRLFIGNIDGIVKIMDVSTKQMRVKPFLDMSSKMELFPSNLEERGLLNLAFHPNFKSNGRFFVFYNSPLAPGEEPTAYERGKGFESLNQNLRISEMRVNFFDPNTADSTFEKVILEIHKPFDTHQGGELMFRDDGYLYIFTGDGGGAEDTYKSSQDKKILLGKVLRIDIDVPADLPYRIPPDNPFLDEEGARPEIYAFGLRNPWRCGNDPGQRITGAGRDRILCGDVGQYSYEEVDLIVKGGNFGWNVREGESCFDFTQCNKYTRLPNESLPVFQYSHFSGSFFLGGFRSVTGGKFYRGCESPALDGKYIFGDFETGQLYALESKPSGAWDDQEFEMCRTECTGDLIRTYDKHITSFGQDQEGEVYMITAGNDREGDRSPTGELLKFVDPFSRGDEDSCFNKN